MGPCEDLVRRAYRAFNDRDIEAAVALMHPEVSWPDATTGEIIRGSHALRWHWRTVFGHMHPILELDDLRERSDGLLEAVVRHILRDPDGTVLQDDRLVHLFTIEDGLIKRVEISPA
jgi:ketosteroid isomerase-like protein